MKTISDIDDQILAALDFDIEELEDLNAPGFWRGVRDGFTYSAAAVGVIGVGIAIT